MTTLKQYKDLDLKAIQQKADIDFAHYTYLKGMCTCCNSPKEFPKRYWKDNTIVEGDDYSRILFKNADNGRGVVTKHDEIEYTCIAYKLSKKQLGIVIEELQKQLGDNYEVVAPKSEYHCIEIKVRGHEY